MVAHSAGTACNSLSKKEGTEVVGHVEGRRTRPHCLVGYILADVAYSRQRPSG